MCVDASVARAVRVVVMRAFAWWVPLAAQVGTDVTSNDTWLRALESMTARCRASAPVSSAGARTAPGTWNMQYGLGRDASNVNVHDSPRPVAAHAVLAMLHAIGARGATCVRAIAARDAQSSTVFGHEDAEPRRAAPRHEPGNARSTAHNGAARAAEQDETAPREQQAEGAAERRRAQSAPAARGARHERRLHQRPVRVLPRFAAPASSHAASRRAAASVFSIITSQAGGATRSSARVASRALRVPGPSGIDGAGPGYG